MCAGCSQYSADLATAAAVMFQKTVSSPERPARQQAVREPITDDLSATEEAAEPRRNG
jgi:hypothetical protein